MTEKNNNKPGQETAPDNNILDFQMDLNPEETTSDETMTGQVEAEPIDALAEFTELQEKAYRQGLIATRPAGKNNIITNKAGSSNIQRVQSVWQNEQEKPQQTEKVNEEPANKPKPHQTKTLNISSQKGIRDFRLNKK